MPHLGNVICHQMSWQPTWVSIKFNIQQSWIYKHATWQFILSFINIRASTILPIVGLELSRWQSCHLCWLRHWQYTCHQCYTLLWCSLDEQYTGFLALHYQKPYQLYAVFHNVIPHTPATSQIQISKHLHQLLLI